ncbi:hypothetical protein KA005_23450 [bacterium]|nr:hypothetical protein [bacterium]
MKVVILVCDKYTWLESVFLYFYRKYWHENPYETRIVNEAAHLGGGDFDIEGEAWSTWVLNYLKQSKEDKFLFIMEDFMIRAPIDTKRVRIAADLCTGNVGCVKLSAPDKWFKRHAKKTEIEGFREYPLDQKFSMSLQTAIWQKVYLFDILRKGESAWQTEHRGSKRLRGLKDKWRILWTESTIIDYHPGGLMEKGELRLETTQQILLNLIKEA